MQLCQRLYGRVLKARPSHSRQAWLALEGGERVVWVGDANPLGAGAWFRVGLGLV